jgi:DNA-binding beta-propeller fold protein YncE
MSIYLPRLTMIRLTAALIGAAIVASGSAHANPYSILVVEEMLGRVTIMAADDPARRVSVDIGYKPHEIAVSADGRTAYVSNFGLNDADNREGTPGQTVSVIDIESAKVRAELRLPADLKAPHGLAFRPKHHQELFVNAELGSRMVVFDASNGRIKRVLEIPAGIHNFLFSGDGQTLFAFASAGTVYRIDPQSGKVRAMRDIGAPVRGLAWTHEEQRLIAAVKGKVVILNPTDLSTVAEFVVPGVQQLFYCVASPDGRLIFAPSVFDGTISVLNAQNGAIVRTLHAITPLRVVLSPDPDLAYVANVSPKGDKLTVVHIHSLDTEDIGGVRDANGLAFSSVLPRALRGP